MTESEILNINLSNEKQIFKFYGTADQYKEVQNFYNAFLNTNIDSEINKNYSFTVERVRLTNSALEALKINNQNDMDFQFTESALKGAFVDVLLPNVKNKRYRDVANKINGKEFVFLIPMGGENEGQFALATGNIKTSSKSIPKEMWMYSDLDTEFEIDNINITKNIMVGPNATSSKINKNSHNIRVLTKNLSNGVTELRDSNIEKIASRIYTHNKSVFFSGHSNIDLVNVAFRENIVNLSTMNLADLSNATTIQYGIGPLMGSYVNQHSNDFFISGKELKSVMPVNKISESIKDDLIYRPEFDLEREYLKKINVYNSSGEFNQTLTDELGNVMKENKFERKMTRTQFSELIGDSLAKQRQSLTSEQVVDYNKSLYKIIDERNSSMSKKINEQMLQAAIQERRKQFAERIESKQKILDAENAELKEMESFEGYKKYKNEEIKLEDFFEIKRNTEDRIKKLKIGIKVNEVANSLSDEELLALNRDREEELLGRISGNEYIRKSYPKNKPEGNFGIDIGMSVEEWNNGSIVKNKQFLNKIGLLNTEESKSSYMLIDDSIQKQIDVKTLKAQQELKNRIVTDFKYNLLQDYGFVDRLTKDGEKDVSKDMIINRFYEYYNKLNNVSDDIAKVKDKLDNTIDEGALLGQIISGRIFDNYTVVGRQNDVKSGKARSVYATDFSLFGHMEQHNQRAGQSADKFSKAVINHNGESINISSLFGGYYSGINEMKYKQQKVLYEQEKQLMKKLAPKINLTDEYIESMPNLLQNQVKVLYADTEGAFLDSNLFTKSFALQNISMQDNKNPFVIHYSSLQGSNAFKKADGTYYSPDEIKKFLSAISSKQELDDEQKIMKEIMLTNLLGKENYKKYNLFKNGDFKADIEEIGNIIGRVKNIDKNEAAYALSQEEAMVAFNKFTNKYFISSDDEARIKLVQKNMLLSGAKTNVKGSNFGLIEDIEFTSEGVQLKVNQLLVQSEGAKGMLNNSKHTARYTNLIKVVNDGTNYYVEGLMNGLYNKNSRGNFGAFLSMTLTTMVSNALQANLDGGADIVNGKIDYQKRLSNFLDSMKDLNLSGSGVKGEGNLKSINLFDLLNIGISLNKESGQIIFTDNNVKMAIENFDPDSPVGLHSVIIENMNKNLAKILGKKSSSMTEEQATAFGYYLINKMYEKYEGDYTNTIDKSSRKGLTIRMRDASIYNSYLFTDETTGALGSKMNLLDNTKGVSYLFNVFPSMMYEAKSRAAEDALKTGRLSLMTLEEAGFNEVVQLLQDKAKGKATKELKEYFALAALKGTEFARGTAFFDNTFSKNVINIADEVPGNYNVTDDIELYLKKSPLGKLISSSKAFDKEKKALKSGQNIKGLITGLDSDLMSNLRNFYDIKNESKVMYNIGTMATGSIMYSLLDFERDPVIKKAFEGISDYKEYKNELKRLIKEIGINGELDIRKAVQGIRLSNDSSVSSGLEEFLSNVFDAIESRVKITDYDAIAKETNKKGFETTLTKDSMLDFIKRLKNVDYENIEQVNASKSINIFKSFLGFAEGYKKAIGGMNSTLFHGLGTKTVDDIFNYNLSYDILKSITVYHSKDTGDFGNIIAGFFKDFGLINRSNYLNIVDLQQISQFENVPFIIDALSVDVGGRNVPTTMLSSLERIMKSNYELIDLKKKAENLPNRFNSELIRTLAEVEGGYSREWYLTRGDDLWNETEWQKAVVEPFKQSIQDESEMTKNYNKLIAVLNRAHTEKKKNKLLEKINPLGQIIFSFNENWKGATELSYLVDETKLSDDELFEVIKGIKSEDVSVEINSKFNSFKNKIKNFKFTEEDADIFEYFDFDDDEEKLSYTMKNYINRISKKRNKINRKDLLKIFDNNFGLIETYDEIDNLITLNYGKNDDYIDVLKDLRGFIKLQAVDAIRSNLKEYNQKIVDVNKILGNVEKMKDLENLDYDSLIEKINRIAYDFSAPEVYKNVVIGLQKRSDKMAEDLPRLILEKEQELLGYLLGRNNGLNKELFGENGKFKDLATIILKNSAAFSPVYAGGVEQSVVNEIKDIINLSPKEINKANISEKDWKKQLKTANKIRKPREKSLFHYLYLVYGDELSADIISDMEERFKTNNFDDAYFEELKRKLSLFTNIVVGDEKMYRNLGMSKRFKNSQYMYEYLSRHPHQYRSSIAPTRYVMLTENDKKSSFIKRIFGNGTGFGNSSQNFLYFIGKRTSIAANGDFDGDIFQIMTLGNKDFRYGEYFKNLTNKEAKKMYDKKLKLYFLLNNVAGEDLQENLKSDKLKYKVIRDLIKDIAYGGKNYDKDGKLITVDDLYDKIEIDYLGITHEKIRVMNKVRKEVIDHSLIPNFTGNLEVELEDGVKKQVSKLTVAMATLFVDGDIKSKLIDGSLTKEEFIDYINGLDVLTKEEKENIAEISDPKILKKFMKKLSKDKNIIKAQNFLHSETKFLEMSGIANTGEVHDKLTTFRKTVSSLINQANLEGLLDQIELSDSINKTKHLEMLLNGRTKDEFIPIYYKYIKTISATNDIGTLIEQASISSKKGRDVNAANIIETMEQIREKVKSRNGKVFMNYEEVTNSVLEFMRTGAKKNALGKEVQYTNLSTNLDDFLAHFIEGYRSKAAGNNSLEMTEFQKQIRQLFLLITNGRLEFLENQNATFEQIFKNEDGVTDITNQVLAKAISTISYTIEDGQLSFIADKSKITIGNLEAITKRQNSFVGIMSDLISSSLPEPTKKFIKKGFSQIKDLGSNSVVMFDSVKNAILGATRFNSKNKTELNKEAEDIIKESEEFINKFESQANKAASEAENVAEAAETIKPKTLEELQEQVNILTQERNSTIERIKKLTNTIDKLNKTNGPVNEEKLNSALKRIQELEQIIASQSDEIEKYKKASQIAAETIAENSDTANKIVKKVKFKKYGGYALGAIVLGTFFSIFQRSRPVVNLDINEKQYEDSKGSVYRNLGQYTMNTNIRSIY